MVSAVTGTCARPQGRGEREHNPDMGKQDSLPEEVKLKLRLKAAGKLGPPKQEGEEEEKGRCELGTSEELKEVGRCLRGPSYAVVTKGPTSQGHMATMAYSSLLLPCGEKTPHVGVRLRQEAEAGIQAGEDGGLN